MAQEREEFDALSKDQKIELRAWQTTVEGRNATKGAKDAYFQSKGDPKRKNSTDYDNNKSKKLKRQVATLQKKVDDHEQFAQNSSALKETTFNRPSTAKTDEKSLSMARKVMNIVAREKKSSAE